MKDAEIKTLYSAKMKPSTLRRVEDMNLIIVMLNENDNKEYYEKLNPFEEGSLRYDRFKRHYIRTRVRNIDIALRFEELLTVYGR